jgi:DNA-binding winged helix-turn-helix (wHTH) protein
VTYEKLRDFLARTHFIETSVKTQSLSSSHQRGVAQSGGLAGTLSPGWTGDDMDALHETEPRTWYGESEPDVDLPARELHSLTAFELDGWIVDPINNTLRRGNEARELTPMAMRVLRVLAEHAGSAVTREQLIHRVWNDNYLTGAKRLTDEIWRIRQAFADDNRNPRLIKTLPRRGYVLLQAPRAMTVPVAIVQLDAGSKAESIHQSGPSRTVLAALLPLILGILVLATITVRQSTEIARLRQAEVAAYARALTDQGGETESRNQAVRR